MSSSAQDVELRVAQLRAAVAVRYALAPRVGVVALEPWRLFVVLDRRSSTERTLCT
eukprot:CAMPEP_0179858328 /NCGR_PEP_ID=MMETSP0982-20121206/12322_1 /TAXON_ID=483367 /ORGANISM="non described non described, Strain CCMP 2436" /LENGTH=55 /DNA_ID=CAMNT_0021745101 /DNA_START=251 /DNA_END=418 /DNA_ORIENTATION=+